MADYSLAKMTHAVKDKGLKYAAVSVVNVIVGQGLLAIFNTVLGWEAVLSNFLSVAISAGPAYLLSRAWVWNKKGKNSLVTEVLPFWGFALLGLLISTGTVAATKDVDIPLMANIASLAAFGLVWVAKFFLLDALIFKVVVEHDLADEESAAEAFHGQPPEAL